MYALGAALGGPLGGLLSDSSIGWRVAFLLQVPICVLHFAVVWAKVSIPAGPGDMMTKLKRIDYLGSLTLVAGVGLLLVGLSVGGNQYAWSNPLTWGTILGGLGGIILFVLVEKFVAREPILAPRILFSRTPGFVSLTNWFASMQVLSLAVIIPSSSVVQGPIRNHLPGAALLFSGRGDFDVVRRSASHPGACGRERVNAVSA